MDKRKVLLLIAIKSRKLKCTYKLTWQLSLTLLKKLKSLAEQFDCFGTKIKIKPIRAEIVTQQTYSLSFSLSLSNFIQKKCF